MSNINKIKIDAIILKDKSLLNFKRLDKQLDNVIKTIFFSNKSLELQ